MKNKEVVKKCVDGLSGKGELTWKLEAGCLRIGGSGRMRDFTDGSRAPWAEDRERIRQVIVEDGVETIGGRAFADYPALEEVFLADSVGRIGWRAFDGCAALSRLDSPRQPRHWRVPGEERALTVGFCAFRGTPLQKEELVIRDGVLLEYCGTGTQVEIPEGVTGIGSHAFSNTPVERVKLPGSLRQIGEGAFSGTGVKEIRLPKGVTRIGAYAFAHSRLELIELSKGLESIEKGAFEGAGALRTVWLENLRIKGLKEAFAGTPVENWDKVRFGKWLLAKPAQPDGPDRFRKVERAGRWPKEVLAKMILRGAVVMYLQPFADGRIMIESYGVTVDELVREYTPRPYLAEEGRIGETEVMAATVEQWQKRLRDEDTWLSLSSESDWLYDAEDACWLMRRAKRGAKAGRGEIWYSWDHGNFWGPLELAMAEKWLLEHPDCYAGSLYSESEK